MLLLLFQRKYCACSFVCTLAYTWMDPTMYCVVSYFNNKDMRDRGECF